MVRARSGSCSLAFSRSTFPMAATWSPDSWRSKPIVQVPTYPDMEVLKDVEAKLESFPPLVFAGEVRGAEGEARRRRGRPGLPAAGRRLRGELQGAQADYIRDYFQLFLQMALILTFAGNYAGGEGGPRRRPVRQAALLGHREAGRQGVAELPRRHHQRPRVHGRRRAFPIRAGSSRPTASRRRP